MTVLSFQYETSQEDSNTSMEADGKESLLRVVNTFGLEEASIFRDLLGMFITDLLIAMLSLAFVRLSICLASWEVLAVCTNFIILLVYSLVLQQLFSSRNMSPM